MKAIIASCLVLVATGLTGLTVGPVEAQPQLKGAPRGTYTHTCSGGYVNQGRLYADCRDQRGQVHATSIELARCSDHNIENNNGLLVCGRHRGDFERPTGGPPSHRPHPGNPGYPGHPGQPGRPGGGGWGNSRAIIVFEHADFRGRSLEIEGPISNLKEVGMNDKISSLATRGRWEVCSDADFRGNCMVVDGDISNLKEMRMNDNISSIRPVRRGRPR